MLRRTQQQVIRSCYRVLRTPVTASEANSCFPVSPSKAMSCPDFSAPRPQTIAVWLSAVLDIGEPVPFWRAHQATSQLGGLPGIILADTKTQVRRSCQTYIYSLCSAYSKAFFAQSSEPSSGQVYVFIYNVFP